MLVMAMVNLRPILSLLLVELGRGRVRGGRVHVHADDRLLRRTHLHSDDVQRSEASDT